MSVTISLGLFRYVRSAFGRAVRSCSVSMCWGLFRRLNYVEFSYVILGWGLAV